MRLLIGLVLLMSTIAMAGPTHYKRDALAGVPIHRLTVDLNSSDIYVTAKVAVGHSEDFAAMCQRLQPIAAVNGGFFDTVTLRPCGDIVVDGRMLYDGCIGPAFIIPKDGSTARIVSQADYAKLDKTTLQLGMQIGPTLVKQGNVALNLKAEGFFHVARYATRVALGLTSDHKLILIMTEVPVSLGKLAEIMGRVCVSAACLDGGTSAAIYAAGKVKAAPGRKLVSLLVILPHTAPDKTPYNYQLTASSP